jgi:hypothetical protein
LTDLVCAYGLLIRANWFTLLSQISIYLRTGINELPNPSVRLMRATGDLKQGVTHEHRTFRNNTIYRLEKKYDGIHDRFLRALLRTPTCSAKNLTELELGRGSRQRKSLWLIEVHFSLTQLCYINNYIYIYIYIYNYLKSKPEDVFK